MIKTALHYKSGNNGAVVHLRLEKFTWNYNFIFRLLVSLINYYSFSEYFLIRFYYLDFVSIYLKVLVILFWVFYFVIFIIIIIIIIILAM